MGESRRGSIGQSDMGFGASWLRQTMSDNSASLSPLCMQSRYACLLSTTLEGLRVHVKRCLRHYTNGAPTSGVDK